MNPQTAVEEPRFIPYGQSNSFAPHVSFPGRSSLESRLPRATVDALLKFGHKIVPWPERLWRAGGFSGAPPSRRRNQRMRRRLAKGGCIRAQPIAQGRTLHVQPHRRPEIALGGTGPLFGIFTRLTYPVAYESIALTDVDVHMIGAGHGSFGPAALAHCIFRLEMRWQILPGSAARRQSHRDPACGRRRRRWDRRSARPCGRRMRRIVDFVQGTEIKSRCRSRSR